MKNYCNTNILIKFSIEKKLANLFKVTKAREQSRKQNKKQLQDNDEKNVEESERILRESINNTRAIYTT